MIFHFNWKQLHKRCTNFWKQKAVCNRRKTHSICLNPIQSCMVTKHVSFLSFNRLLFCKTWEKRKKGLKIFVNFLVNQYCSVSCIIYPSFNWFQLPRQQGPVINCVKYLGYSFLLHHPLPVINSFKDL